MKRKRKPRLAPPSRRYTLCTSGPSSARRFLEAHVSVWPSLTRGDLNEWVRACVWAATWNPDARTVDIVFDELGIENAVKENPRLLAPLPAKVLRILKKKRPTRKS